MSLIFGIISVVYVALIFILAGYPGKIELIKRFNPASLLHIPLYAFLTFLLIRTFLSGNKSSFINSPVVAISISAAIAICVAIFDEVNQIRIPGRDASFLDVMLDFLGIAIITFVYYLLKLKC